MHHIHVSLQASIRILAKVTHVAYMLLRIKKAIKYGLQTRTFLKIDIVTNLFPHVSDTCCFRNHLV